MKLSNSGFAHLLIITAASLIVAGACYYLGGVVAEISGNTGWAPAFKAGGSLAGFLIVFFALLYGYSQLGAQTLLVTVRLDTHPPLRKSAAGNEVSYCVMNPNSTNRRTVPSSLVWEVGGACVHLRDITPGDLIMVQVKLKDGRTLETHFFSPLAHIIPLKEITQ